MGLFSRKKKEEFVSPMTGTLLPIEQCPDPVFAEKIMGDGFAIELTGVEVTAPVSGTKETGGAKSRLGGGTCGCQDSQFFTFYL